jgi:hypothetical protein
MQIANNTEEAFAYRILVSSRLDTLRMVIRVLATTFSYGEMVGSMWGRDTRKMERDSIESLSIRQMAKK